MLIVDAQVHLWASGAEAGPPSHHRQQPVFSAEELLGEMKEVGVDRVLIVPPNWNDTTAKNDYALECARRFPDRLAVMGTLALDKPENKLRIQGWKRQPGMLGLRLVFLAERARFLTDGTADWVWTAAEREGLPIMVYAPGFLPRIGGIAERQPGLRLIVDHFGVNVAFRGETAFALLPELLALARYPNVAVKMSGAPSLATDPYPYRSLDKYIRQIYDVFGPARMFWGSDLTRMPCSYLQCVTHFTEEIPWLSAADKTLIMGSAICDWIDWHLPK
jgi:predicted TIM-barrel fold metal-dependent hydrolase